MRLLGIDILRFKKYSLLVEILFQLGANIRARDNTGWDPFMYAIRSGSSQLIALMLE